MISADQFLQCDVRVRQGKMKVHDPFGGLAINVCGDFLQLPPVSRDGSKKSLACILDDTGHEVSGAKDADGEPTPEIQEASNAESRQGLELWRSYFRRVVCLTVNVRAPGVLSRLQAEMRAGHISDEMWSLYMSRVLQPSDPRLLHPPFSTNNVCFVVHRHKIRVMRSFEEAKEQSSQLKTSLFMVQARDEAAGGSVQTHSTGSGRPPPARES